MRERAEWMDWFAPGCAASVHSASSLCRLGLLASDRTSNNRAVCVAQLLLPVCVLPSSGRCEAALSLRPERSAEGHIARSSALLLLLVVFLFRSNGLGHTLRWSSRTSASARSSSHRSRLAKGSSRRSGGDSAVRPLAFHALHLRSVSATTGCSHQLSGLLFRSAAACGPMLRAH